MCGNQYQQYQRYQRTRQINELNQTLTLESLKNTTKSIQNKMVNDSFFHELDRTRVYTQEPDVTEKLSEKEINKKLSDTGFNFNQIFIFDNLQETEHNLRNSVKKIHYTKIEKGQKIQSPQFTGCVMAAFKFNRIDESLFDNFNNNQTNIKDTYVAHVYQGGDGDSTLREFYLLEKWGFIKILNMFRPATKNDEIYRKFGLCINRVLNGYQIDEGSDNMKTLQQLLEPEQLSKFLQWSSGYSPNQNWQQLDPDLDFIYQNNRNAIGYMKMNQNGKITASTGILGTEITYTNLMLQDSTNRIRAELEERVNEERNIKNDNIIYVAQIFLLMIGKIENIEQLEQPDLRKIYTNRGTSKKNYYYKCIMHHPRKLEDYVLRISRKNSDTVPIIYANYTTLFSKLYGHDIYLQEREYL